MCAYLLLRAGAWKGTSIASHSVICQEGLTDPHFIMRILWFRERWSQLEGYTTGEESSQASDGALFAFKARAFLIRAP